MPLSDEERRKIEEEERYRVEVREKANKKREPMGCGDGCLGIILIIILFILGLTLIGSLSGEKTTSNNGQEKTSQVAPTPSVPPETKVEFLARLTRELDALQRYNVKDYLHSTDSIFLPVSFFSLAAAFVEEGTKYQFEDKER